MTNRNTGILTTEQRRILLEGKIKSNIKWNLLDIKKGRLTKKIKELAKDFEIISDSIDCWEWFTNIQIKNNLNSIDAMIKKITDFYPLPGHQLKAVTIKGKRRYCLNELFNVQVNPAESRYYNMQSSARKKLLNERHHEYFLYKMKKSSSLKENEWRFIKNYLQKNLKDNYYDLPLEEGKYYTWKEVKKELE